MRGGHTRGELGNSGREQQPPSLPPGTNPPGSLLARGAEHISLHFSSISEAS